MFVKERFRLAQSTVEEIRGMRPEFGYDGFGEFVYYRTYSREVCAACRSGIKHGGGRDYCPVCGPSFSPGQEVWADTVLRTMAGVLSIRKDWYVRNHITWDETFWQHYGRHMAIAMFRMQWMPPGRGLWAMGTDFVNERGSMALNNCGYAVIGEDIASAVGWIMDALMCGVGVGFGPTRNDDMVVHAPRGTYDFEIPDSREGWCDATERLINAYLTPGQPRPRLIYDKVRPAGRPIRGFGGVSSGPEPLMRLHAAIEQFMDMYGCEKWYDSFLLKTDIANCAGCCVVAGNVRRSAELLAGELDDLVDLKDYAKYPYREGHGWMSNNSVFLREDEDFERLDEIASRIIRNGEPGFINLRNLPFGRIGKGMDGLRPDRAVGFNPCGEQPLEDRELCVSGQTRIQTISGSPRIAEVVGQVVKVWNGAEWTEVTPFLTSQESDLYRVTFSDGSFLDCTKYHTFYLSRNREKVEASKTCFLKEGDRLLKYGLTDPVVGKYVKHAYEYGFFMGDGCWDTSRGEPVIDLYGDDLLVKMTGTRGPVSAKSDYNVLHARQYLSSFLEKEKCLQLKHTDSLPDWVFEMDGASIQKFVEGYLDADGTLCKQANTDNYSFSGPRGRLLDLQILLRRVGVNNTCVGFQHDGETNFGHRSEPLYRLTVASPDCAYFGGQLKRAVRIGSHMKPNPKWRGYISRQRYQKVEKIEYLGKGPTYCFDEPKLHMGVFNNVLTGQCTLVETLPTRCDSVEEWYRACEYAAVYAATVTLLPTHRPETNAVMLRNRRIGVGIIDVSGWREEVGTTRLTKYLRAGYDKVRSTTRWTNSEAGVPLPIRVTTIKPGGTTPKLPRGRWGAASGMRSGWQWPTFGHTLRRVRVARNSPVHRVLATAGVPHEPDVFSAGTDCFEWPIDQGDGGRVKPATRVSIWEQANMLVLLQREWSDNAVSNTLYFRPMWDLAHKIKLGESFYPQDIDPDITEQVEGVIPILYEDLVEPQEYEDEKVRVRLERDQWTNDWYVLVYQYDPNHEEDDVPNVLASIAPLTKSVAVLPHTTKGVYRQMPEEGITRDEYLRRQSAIRPIDWSTLRGSDGMDEKYCDGPACEFTAKSL